MAIARQIMAGQGSDTIHIGAAALIGVLVDNAPLNAGAHVVTVETGTPADNAGLVPGDVINSLAGQTVTSATSLTNTHAATSSGTAGAAGLGRHLWPTAERHRCNWPRAPPA